MGQEVIDLLPLTPSAWVAMICQCLIFAGPSHSCFWGGGLCVVVVHSKTIISSTPASTRTLTLSHSLLSRHPSDLLTVFSFLRGHDDRRHSLSSAVEVVTFVPRVLSILSLSCYSCFYITKFHSCRALPPLAVHL